MILGSVLKQLLSGDTQATARVEAPSVDASATKLNLGCGPKIMPGWVNIDMQGAPPVVIHDLTKPLPVASETVEYIYNEHFIEHITRDQGRFLLSECRRVLKPGGVIRVSTPDLRVLVEQYLSSDLQASLQAAYNNGWYPQSAAQLMNGGMRLWGHQFVYDEVDFLALFKESGFVNVTVAKWRESVHPVLRNLETRSFQRDLVVEAIK